MQRWWAPQRPTVEPDAVVLAMLEPGDLGSAMLATHRAGAAAIETVSKAALPSEEGIVAAMVAARANAAHRIVDSVSKCVVSPTYAALLVRDVLDDAEEGALTVYRTAVNKGVSPPVAAARAAAVYGVPATAMNKYVQLASDPRSNPVAVADAADRVLMSYVSQLVEQEADVYEDVSKAPERPWDESQVRRDPAGRFAEEHGGAQAQRAPEGHPPLSALDRLRIKLGLRPQTEASRRVSEALNALREPEKKQAEPKTEAPTVRRRASVPTRAERANRATRAQRSTRSATRQTDRRVGTSRRTTQARRATVAERQQLARRDVEMQRIAQQLNAKDRDTQLPTPSKQLVPTGRLEGKVLPDLLHDKWGETTAYDLEEHSYTVTLDRASSQKLLANAAIQAASAKNPSERIFRMGYMLDDAPSPAVVADSADADHARSGLADVERDDDQPAPSAQFVHPDELKNPSETDREFLERERGLTATKKVVQPDGSVREYVDYDELNAIHILPTYTKFGTMQTDEDGTGVRGREWALVHFQRRRDLPSELYMPTIDEFVVVRGARGNEEGPSPSKMVTHLDPSQAFRLVNAPMERPGARIRPQTFWDPDNGVRVNRWFLEPVEEYEVEDLYGDDVTKADQAYQSQPGQQRPRGEATRRVSAMFEQLHPRDEDGKFTTKHSRRSTVSPSAIPQPVTAERATRATRASKPTRATRTTRMTRVSTPVARATATRRGVGRRAIERSTPERARISESVRMVNLERLAELSEKDPARYRELPVLDDRRRYIVMPMISAAQLGVDAGDDTRPVSLGADAARELAQRAMLDGEDVLVDMAYNVQDEIQAKEGTALDGFTWNRRPAGRGRLSTDSDHVAMGQRIREIFEAFPNIAQIHVDTVTRPGEYQLYANRQPVSPQVLLEAEDDLDWSRPVTLVPLGHYRTNEMMRQRTMPNGGTYLTDATLDFDDEDPSPVNADIWQYRLQNAPVARYRIEND